MTKRASKKPIKGKGKPVGSAKPPRFAKTDAAIALSVDANYFPFCSVAILSLMENGRCADIPVFVFADDFSPADMENFRRLGDAAGCNITLIRLGEHDLKNLPPVEHMSRATYLRLFIPSVLKMFRRVLYLDSDLLVLSDLREVFAAGLGGHALGAVRDPIGEKYCKIDFFKTGRAAYFNAGVLLIDTAEWTKRRISEKVVALALDSKQRDRISAFADQCLLNYVVRGAFAELGKKYNWAAYEPRDCSPRFLELAPTPSGADLREAKILHFMGGRKPWMPESSLSDIWETYKAFADRSPWAAEVAAAKNRPPAAPAQPPRKPLREAVPGRWDYVSPNFARVMPDGGFPQMAIGDVEKCGWRWLRRAVPHNWYCDRRNPQIGFASRDEASILHNTALDFAGRRCLEVGCWMGWSAAHLLLGGVELDIVDPVFSNATHLHGVRGSLGWTAKHAPPGAKAILHRGSSPSKVEQLARAHSRKWSLAFIDGDHEGDGPLNDAIECEKHLEDDALVLFHDLASPAVAKGLDFFRDRGWNTIVFNTMQIMGAAWRGNATPVEHQPDPKIDWEVPAHLSGYAVSSFSFGPAEAEFERLFKLARPHTSVGRAGLKSLHENALRICRQNIEGDFFDCGFDGPGSAVLLAAVAKTHSKSPRKVMACGKSTGAQRTALLKTARSLGVGDLVEPVDWEPGQPWRQPPETSPRAALLHVGGGHGPVLAALRCFHPLLAPQGFLQADSGGSTGEARRAATDFGKASGLRFESRNIGEGVVSLHRLAH